MLCHPVVFKGQGPPSYKAHAEGNKEMCSKALENIKHGDIGTNIKRYVEDWLQV